MLTLKELDSSFIEAERQWKSENPRSQRPAFWELDIDIDSLGYEKLAGVVAGRISRNSGQDAGALVAFLFCLLRGRISRARGNRLWPEVTAEIESLSGTPVASSRTAEFFRDKLRKKLGLELESSEHHFKFVHLCFDQTGIGVDRARYIRSFFRQLLGQIQECSSEEAAFVERAFDHFLESSADPGETDQLRTVLLKTGVALVKLARAFQSGEAGELVLEWDWENLRAYWLETRGEDLGRLSPEAKQVFEEVFPSIQQCIRRSDLIKYSEQKKIDIVLPDGRELTLASDSKTLPVGWAMAKIGGRQKEVLVIDDNGNSPGSYQTYGKDEWIESGEHCTYVRPTPFTILKDDVQYAYPHAIYTGDGFSNQKLYGYAWSGASGRFASLEVVETSQRLELEAGATLYLNFLWLEGDSGLKLSVRELSLGRSAYTGEVVLRVDEEIVWEGALTNGRLSEKLPHRIEVELPLASKENFTVDVSAKEFDESMASISLKNPLNAPAFFVVNRRVLSLAGMDWIRAEHLTGASSNRLKLMTEREARPPESKEVGFNRLGDSNFATHPTQYELSLGSDNESMVHIILAGLKHSFGLGEAIDIIPTGNKTATFGGVSVASEGEIDIVDDVSQWAVRIAGDTGKQDFSISIANGRTNKRFDRTSLSGYTNTTDRSNSLLAIGRFIEDRGINLETGPVSLTIEGNSTTNRTISAFLLDDAKVLPGKFGDRSNITLSWRETRSLSSQSEACITPLEDLSIGSCSRRLWLSAESFIDFYWEPVVFDVFVTTSEKANITDEVITLKTLLTGAMLVPACKSEHFSLQVSEKSLIDIPPEGLELSSLDYADSEPGPFDYSILCNHKKVRDIEVDRSIQSELSAASREEGGRVLIVEGLEIFTCSSDISLSISSRDVAISTSVEAPLTNHSGIFSYAVERLEFTITDSHSGEVDEDYFYLVVSDLSGDLSRVQLNVEVTKGGAPPTSPAGDPKSRIKELMEAGRGAPESFRLDEIVHILDEELDKTGDFPVAPKNVIAGLAKAPSTKNNQRILGCLQLLEAIHSGVEFRYEKPIPDDPSYMGICLSTLQIIEELLRYRVGTMNMAYLASSLAYMVEAANAGEDERSRAWATYVAVMLMQIIKAQGFVDVALPNTNVFLRDSIVPDSPLLKIFDTQMKVIRSILSGE